MPNLPGILPSSKKGGAPSKGSIAQTAKSSIFSDENAGRAQRAGATSSMERAMREKQYGENAGPTTSIGHMTGTNKVSTSILRQEPLETNTSIYGRSREAVDTQDDKRFEFGRRQIFAKKIEERKLQIRETKKQMKGHGRAANQYMKKMVKKYAWKKPIGQKYDQQTRNEMKKKIEQAQPFKKFSHEEVDAMKNLVDRLE